MARGGRRISRNKRSLYFSALRAFLFNQLLAARVGTGNWNKILPGDVCMLQGSRSLFDCEAVDEDILERARMGDIHPGLPLWGRGSPSMARDRRARELAAVQDGEEICDFLEGAGLELAWRPARMLADDFCWQFCDDGSLQLDFALGAGCYATALLGEFVHCDDASVEQVLNKKDQGIE
jgi:tRNA pseudouridine13 synthase